MEGSVGRRERHPRTRRRVRHQVGSSGQDRRSPQGSGRQPHGPTRHATHVVRPADGQVAGRTAMGVRRQPGGRSRPVRRCCRHRSRWSREDCRELRPDECGRPPEGVPAGRSDDHAQRCRGGDRSAAWGPRRGDDPGVGLFVGLGSDRPRVASDRDGRRRRRRLRRCRRTHRGAAHRGVLHDAGHVDPQRRA
ncbi:Uncharacterised protein [Mycobacterium tuberculosis]|uniref:Uncharacterized protein n=1 Tax=Mycobacterium tuberculosis TaxID=1773 RepID=A0A655EZW2_MYCTX|nr:Uncharacterised protein [Mycobacterium tuberculosis]CNV40941.1 Uncharacterised protein [Mycobacterium tuberculosis]CNV82707.1 Uncharacterised protein [Mycobacterium tuberculosis]COX31224.1 Uncharacterised protein [Mycobacterium tuberculosis]COX33352.1 Uncharacterised protein [Mycobacterium tuberculosis]